MMPLSLGPPNDVSSYAPDDGMLDDALPWQFFRSEFDDDDEGSSEVLEQ